MTVQQLQKDLEQRQIRVWVEAGRLRYRAPKGAFTSEMRARVEVHRSELIATLTEHTESSTDDTGSSLSFSQERLWFFDQLEPHSKAYNIPVALHLTGPLDVAALELAINELLKRQEILRAVCHLEGENLRQLILPHIDRSLDVVSVEDSTEAERLMHIEAGKPFDLAKGPLFRAKLFSITDNDYIFIMTLHHFIADGWSMPLLNAELSELYAAHIQHRPHTLPALPVQYIDFARQQRKETERGTFDHELEYWKKKLDGVAASIELPTNRTRPPVQTYTGSTQPFKLPAELCTELTVFSQREGVTLFMTLLTAFKILLYRYSNQEDIVVGTVTSNRRGREMENLVGSFSNDLIFRTDLAGNPTFREALARVREVALQAYANQDLPFERLVAELQPERDTSRAPVFQTMFLLQQRPEYSVVALPGLSVERIHIDLGISRLDLYLKLVNTGSDIWGSIEYNTDLFDADTIERMVEHLEILLCGIVARPNRRVLELPLLSSPERTRLLFEWNNTLHQPPKDACIHDLIGAQVERTPDAIAIVFEKEEITYGELNLRANRLANHLISEGIGRGSRVGLLLERSVNMVVALLGVLKTGGAYVCLDPDHPQSRISYILFDTGADCVLSEERLLDRLPDTCPHILCLDRDQHLFEGAEQSNPAVAMQPEDLSYIVYTSGSTGEPKGIMSHHSGVANYLAYVVDTYGIGPEDTILQLPSLTFDASVRDLIGSLSAGAKVVIIRSNEAKSIDLILKKVCHHHVSCLLSVVPSLLDALIKIDHLAASVQGILRLILVSGEPLQFSACRQATNFFGHQVKLVNQYGPTECTMTSTYQPIESLHDQDGLVLAGKPVGNYQIYVLGPDMTLAPINVRGEIYIGGKGVAWGYVGQAGLTAEHFLPDPFSNHAGARIYKTGDLGRWQADGRLEVLGRLDHQAKINGYRVEPGEIESVLRDEAAVAEAVVVIREDTPGSQQLVSYLVAKTDSRPSDETLRASLALRLPSNMIPGQFVWLDKFPLTTTGKIDRKALPAPQREQSDEMLAPFTLVERIVADIWARALNMEKIWMNDDFFKLGGNSLQSAQLCHRISEAFNIEFPLKQLFQAATIAGVASYIENIRVSHGESDEPAEDSRASMVALQPYGEKPPIFLVPGGFSDERIIFFLYGKLIPHLGDDQPVYAFRARGVEGETQSRSDITEVAAGYIRELREKQPEGPYQIAGFCTGGIVAYEMAQQLHEEGERMSTLVLADTRLPRRTRYLYYVGQRIKDRAKRNYAMLKQLPKRVAHHFRASSTMSVKSRLFYLREKSKNTKLFYDLATKPYMVLHPNPNVARRMQRGRINYQRTLYKYRPKPYPGHIHLLVSEGMMKFTGPEIWSKLAKGGIKLVQTRGNHRTHISEYANHAAKALKVCFTAENNRENI